MKITAHTPNKGAMNKVAITVKLNDEEVGGAICSRGACVPHKNSVAIKAIPLDTAIGATALTEKCLVIAS